VRAVGGHVEERLGLVLVVVLTASAYAAVGLFRHWHFDTSYDLGIFDQAVWHMSRFEIPGSTISGYRNILGDHFYPVLFLFAVPYWVFPHAETLIVAQAILMASSIVPVYYFLRGRLSISLSFGLVIAYALFWGLQKAINSDVHEMAFAPLVIACAVLAMDKNRWGWLWISCLVLVGIKEDLIVLVAAMGAYVFAQGNRRQGLALAAFGVLAFVTIVTIVIPSFSGGWASGGAYAAIWQRPWTALAVIVTPHQKLLTILFWLAPFCFLSLRSPLVLLAVPVGIERLLSSFSSHWGWGGHYTAPLAPLLAMSAGDGLGRLSRNLDGSLARWRRGPTTLVTLSVILASVIPGHQPFLRLFTIGHYRITVDRGTAATALALIPPDASVLAQACLLPHLSQRATIYVLDVGAPETEYVIASVNLNAWPLADRDELSDVIQQRKLHGYVTIFDEAGWVVLKAPRATR
jgi:uncharacterized membrane protein